MNKIIIVSNSKNKAFKTEKKTLDKYANRIALKVWELSIHEKGLKIILNLLKASASKNTNISFFKNNEIIFSIGQNKRFSVKSMREQEPFHKISGRWHDLGKKSRIFQEMIELTDKGDKETYQNYFIRHEYLSLLYLEYFILKNELVDKEFYQIEIQAKSFKEYVKERIENYDYFSIFKEDTSFFDFLFIVATHHKLPNYHDNVLKNHVYISKNRNQDYDKVDISLNSYEKDTLKKDIETLKKIKTKPLKSLLNERMKLLFADANGSSMKLQKKLSEEQLKSKYSSKLKAKTLGDISKESAFQTYLEHAKAVTLYTEKIDELIKEKPFSNWISDNKEFVFEETDIPKFQWQRKAIDFVAENINRNIPTLTFLGSSTGAGKTRFGFKLHQLISKYKRLTILNGLRSLTLQTGTAYKELGILNEEEISVMIGSAAVKKIYEQETNPEEIPFEDRIVSDFKGRNKTLLNYFEDSFLPKNKERFLDSPVLICTLDYLYNAVKMNKQKHIYPLLRLSSSDLFIDEIDNFDIRSQEALLNLVFLIGLYGSNLTISTATIYPEYAEALYTAYSYGVEMSEKKKFNTFYLSDFNNFYLKPLDKNFKEFFEQVGKNREYSLKNNIEIEDITFENILEKCVELHNNEHEGDETEYSVGLIRIANIKNILNTIENIYPKIDKYKDINFQIVCYHSQMTLLQRTFLEKELDSLLKRKTDKLKDKNFFKNGKIKKKNIVIVIASPVEEVGRDHDFDWAIIEPSSQTSIVQTIGRVFRHRNRDSEKTNIFIMDKNFRIQDFEFNEKEVGLCYIRPGLETKNIPFSNNGEKNLRKLIPAEDINYLQTNKNIYSSKENSLPFFERKVLKEDISFKMIYEKKNYVKFFFSQEGFSSKDLRQKSQNIIGFIDRNGNVLLVKEGKHIKVRSEVISRYKFINTFFQSKEFKEFSQKYLKNDYDYMDYNYFSFVYYGEDIPTKVRIIENILIEEAK